MQYSSSGAFLLQPMISGAKQSPRWLFSCHVWVMRLVQSTPFSHCLLVRFISVKLVQSRGPSPILLTSNGRWSWLREGLWGWEGPGGCSSLRATNCWKSINNTCIVTVTGERPGFASKHLVKLGEHRLASRREGKGYLSNWRTELQWSASKGAVLCLHVDSTASDQDVSFTRCGGLRTWKCSRWTPRHTGSSTGVIATWSCTPTWDQAGLTMSSTCGR